MVRVSIAQKRKISAGQWEAWPALTRPPGRTVNAARENFLPPTRQPLSHEPGGLEKLFRLSRNVRLPSQQTHKEHLKLLCYSSSRCFGRFARPAIPPPRLSQSERSFGEMPLRWM